MEIDSGDVKNKAGEMGQRTTDHFKNKILPIDETDKMVWGLVTDVPKVTKPVAIISAILNFIIPGAGTLCAACSSSENVSKT